MTAETLTRDQAFELYYRHSSIPEDEPGMVGGAPGRRFMTNGHFAMAVSEDVYEAALAVHWRNVTPVDFWAHVVAHGFGRRAETVPIPSRWSVDEDGHVEIGSVRIANAYLELLRTLGASHVDIIHDHPTAFAIARDVCIVSVVPA